jgi:N-acetylglutamate synthase
MEAFYSELRIRPGTAADLDGALQVWQQQAGVILRADDTPAVLQPLLITGQLRLFVAECEAVLVGAVLAGDDGRRGYLYHLAVTERKQGRGLGRALVEAALEDLATAGITRAHVFVQNAQLSARAFWERMGWQPRGDLVVYTHVAAESPHA